jgi:hypothetical protein
VRLAPVRKQGLAGLDGCTWYSHDICSKRGPTVARSFRACDWLHVDGLLGDCGTSVFEPDEVSLRACFCSVRSINLKNRDGDWQRVD